MSGLDAPYRRRLPPIRVAGRLTNLCLQCCDGRHPTLFFVGTSCGTNGKAGTRIRVPTKREPKIMSFAITVTPEQYREEKDTLTTIIKSQGQTNTHLLADNKALAEENKTLKDENATLRKIFKFTHEQIKIMRDVINVNESVILATNNIDMLRDELADNTEHVQAKWNEFIVKCNEVKAKKDEVTKKRKADKLMSAPPKKRHMLDCIHTAVEEDVDLTESLPVGAQGA